MILWALPALVAGVAAVTWGAGPRASAGGDKPAADKPPARMIDPKVKELLAERLAAVRQIHEELTRAFGLGATTSEGLHQAHLAVLNAELDLCESHKDRVAVLEKIVAAARAYEARSAKGVDISSAPALARARAKVARLDAEINLQRAKADASAPAK
ncbi:MAG: hypothetical protein U0746_10480 [Gemmataceae bacterium]